MKKVILLSLILVTLLLFFGCAVMKIDVDVYKGPLANNEDVQTEQMAVMAIGAKPLLRRLQEQLENNRNLPHAQIVEAVLSLYRDRLSEDLLNFSKDKDNAFARYRSASLVFYNPHFSEVWSILEKGMKKEQSGALKTLYDGYKDYFKLGEKWYWKGDILVAHLQYKEKDPEKTPSLGDWGTIFGKYTDPDKIDANVGFEALKRKDVVDFHAGLLFKDRFKSRKDEFVCKVETRAEAFLEMRDALRQLMLVTLKALGKKDHYGYFILGEYKEAQAAAIKLAAELIQPRNLKVALLTAERNEATKSMIELREKLEELKDSKGPYSGCYLEWGHDKFQRFLEDELKNRPSKTIDALLEADEYFVSGEIKNYALIKKIKDPFIKDPETYRSKSMRRYGLVIGPNPITDKTIRSLSHNVNKLNESLAGALGRGRLDEGLETLIENYLKRADDGKMAKNGKCRTGNREDNKCSEDNLPERERLIDALVGFAEKVLFVANYEELLKAKGIQEVIGAPEESEKQQALKKDIDIKQYTMVLQAIGNSILSLADEYRQRKKYESGLKKRWATELEALKNTFSRDATTVLSLAAEQMRIERDSSAQLETDPLDLMNKKSLPTTFDALKKHIDDGKTELDKLKKRMTDDNFKTLKEKLSMLIGKIEEKLKAADANSDEGKVLEQAREKLTAFLAENRRSFDLNIAIIKVTTYGRDWAAKKGNVAVSASALMDELILAIKDDSAIRDDPDFRTTVKMLGERKFSITSLGEIGKTDQDPRDVLDLLISALRYQYIQEIQANGAGSKIAENIASAIRSASFYRSGMIYLRPAGAYLRNSYPSTSLQPSSGTNWVNMLDIQGLRGIPLWDHLKPQLPKTIEEIDKQFWQNINNVRLAGSGNTNYVIAKDDIGNWYVKAYSSDPGPIIESAKNLALFSLGPKLKANMLGQLKTGEKKIEKVTTTQDDSTGASTTAQDDKKKADIEPTAFERVLNKYEAKYKEQTENDKKEVEDLLRDNGGGIVTKIKTVWESNDHIKNADGGKFLQKLGEQLTSSAKTILKEAFDELTKTPDKDKQTPEKSDGYRIIRALNNIRRFYNLLVRSIKDIHVTDGPRLAYENAKNTKDPSEGDKLTVLKHAGYAEEAALREATSIVRDILTEYTNKRMDAVNQYKTAIIFMGDTTAQ